MIEAGHPPKQAEAAAYRQQRADRATHSRRSPVPENASHAPGTEAHETGIRQRQRMGRGEGPMAGGSFGVGSIPGTHVMHSHGEHMPHDGVHLADHERAGPPMLHQGKGNMHATAHSNHGPHHHPHEHVHKAPEGMRPHHVGAPHGKKK